ncbi:UDP-glucose 4-epimerase [Amphritea atlantica]|uniref:UDP-glucose 4-epimerase n=1 Tax=Amphritea atlantica TaxID=355243 RepID=A0A1H9H7M7_9GAMM|nr:NAD-dependent epimerase/dehydratase family protein [Amphritea atlantica]SEQ58257.1 UDP-glucose 4-epimerase [Amphritea atlantica]
MKLLVVGGFGFIGKHLIERALSSEVEFTVVARKDPDSGWAGYPYVLENTIDNECLESLSKTHDAVVYMASSSIPATGSFIKELTENVEPAVQIVERLTYYNPAIKVIYLSSGGQVYGNDYSRPMCERDTCFPVSPYGFGKLMTEQGLAFLQRTRGIKLAILRVANPVGKWQYGLRQGLVNVVYQSLKSGEPIKIFGSGEEVRDYLDADELAELVLKITNSQFDFKVWNVGSGVATSTLSLVEKIEKYLGISGEKLFFPRRKFDPKSAVLDCRKLQLDMNWKASLTIDQILEKTLSHKMKQ